MGKRLKLTTQARNLPLFRRLLRELHLSGNKESIAERYVIDQFHRHQVTSRKLCREQNELEHMARSYACYLESKRKLEEIHSRYHSGERSIENSAKTVGLTLPKTYQE